ncbi:hypothetical protein GEMRC1_013419 [Eukaryota sp. GEM-RC1]
MASTSDETLPLVPASPLPSGVGLYDSYARIHDAFEPFIHNIVRFSFYEWIKVFLFTFTVFPIRLISSIIIVILIWICIYPVTIFNTSRKSVRLYIRLISIPPVKCSALHQWILVL